MTKDFAFNTRTLVKLADRPRSERKWIRYCASDTTTTWHSSTRSHGRTSSSVCDKIYRDVVCTAGAANRSCRALRREILNSEMKTVATIVRDALVLKLSQTIKPRTANPSPQAKCYLTPEYVTYPTSFH